MQKNFIQFLIIISIFVYYAATKNVTNPTKNVTNPTKNVTNPTKTIHQSGTYKEHIWGPGLNPKIVLPVRYFFIASGPAAIDHLNGNPDARYDILIKGATATGICQYNLNQLHRIDGTTIIRYRMYKSCPMAEIQIRYDGRHIADSPYKLYETIEPELCSCPQEINRWLHNNECRLFEEQIYNDLKPFAKVNLTKIHDKIIQTFNQPNSISLCNYIIRDNEIYRKCYGQYTGFKMFMDATLQSIVRKVQLPDMEFFVNLGDWPLVKKGGQTRTTGPYPIFSWCGSTTSFDIVLPTYDLTESTIENMGRVSLDMLSVQQNIRRPWPEKINKAFWRGRDARRERLQLIDLARKHPDMLNASLTNFFFFRDEEQMYGPKVAHISFMDFFEYKYQINIDGTVAAYRLPYLLGGDSIVLKQKSPFYEHFYNKLIPFHHYIPFERDLSDLVEKIQWARNHEYEIQQIRRNAEKFVNENLLPKDIYCYHVLLFKKWSKNLVDSIRIHPDMERVPIQTVPCDCQTQATAFQHTMKDEL